MTGKGRFCLATTMGPPILVFVLIKLGAVFPKIAFGRTDFVLSDIWFMLGIAVLGFVIGYIISLTDPDLREQRLFKTSHKASTEEPVTDPETKTPST